jgi:hypothetical protein
MKKTFLLSFSAFNWLRELPRSKKGEQQQIEILIGDRADREMIDDSGLSVVWRDGMDWSQPKGVTSRAC